MDPEAKERYEVRARTIKAIAHPTRLFIIDELSRGERCVCELTDLIGADISTVSKHLSLLRASGLVKDEKRGIKQFYRLQCPCVLDFLGCIDSITFSAAKAQWAMVSDGAGREAAKSGVRS